VALFSSMTFASGPSYEPALAYGFAEASLRARVSDLLARRFRGQSRRVDAGLAVLDDAAGEAAIDSLIHAQVLLESPSLATSGTELARRLNAALLARLNRSSTGASVYSAPAGSCGSRGS
jgi:hypothetical protein